MTEKPPICYDLFCGLGGWAEGFLAEGYECVGFDIEAHDYGFGGYPGKLVLRDVRSIHGSELKDAACFVGSSPCQEFSYRAQPWKRAKSLPPPYLGMELFNAQFRIQREASAAAGRHIPMVVENVRGAQKWIGRARWHYGSFYLWGDVPALMPVAPRGVMKQGVTHRSNGKTNFHASAEGSQKVQGIPKHARKDFGWNHSEELQAARRNDATKVPGISLSRGKSVGFNVTAAQRYREGVKFSQSGDAWFDGKPRDKMLGHKGPAAYSSRSNSRKAASAMIVKIPFSLARHIAQVFKPR